MEVEEIVRIWRYTKRNGSTGGFHNKDGDDQPQSIRLQGFREL